LPISFYHLFGHLFRPDWARFREINRLGLPIAVTLVLEVAVFAAAVFLMGLIGRDSLAAHAVAIQIASLAFMLPLGLSQAATVRVGIFYGRKDPAGVALAGKVSFLIGIGAAVLLSTIMILIPGRLVGLFVDASTPEGLHVFGLAVTFVIVAAAFQLADGVQAVGAGVLRGLQDTRWPMFIAAFGYWVVGLGIAFWLGFPQGLEGLGIWIGLAAGLAVVAVMMVTRWSLRGRIGLVPVDQA
jgi:MATE family multidrug resistance protein